MDKVEKPVHPNLILAAAMIIPGAGHLWLGMAGRGLILLFFTILFGWVSGKIMPEDATFFGKHVGGIFVFGVSILDAYRFAGLRYDAWRRDHETTVVRE